MATLTPVTVREGTKYGPEYVTALKNQVPGLICLGDDRPLRSNHRGWFAKFELFAPWNADLRPMLFFDLDTYVFGPVDTSGIDTSLFWMIDDFNTPQKAESGVMVIPDAPISDTIWTCCDTYESRGGDGAHLRQFPHRRLNTVLPGLYSYKNHCRDEKPADARIICFHGRPKPPDTTGWALDHWNTNI